MLFLLLELDVSGSRSVTSFEGALVDVDTINASACSGFVDPDAVPTTVANINTTIFVNTSYALCGNLLVDASMSSTKVSEGSYMNFLIR